MLLCFSSCHAVTLWFL